MKTSTYKIDFKWLLYLLIFFGMSNSYAQQDLRDCGYGCTTNSFTITDVYLSATNVPGTPLTNTFCNVGQSINVYMIATISSNRNSAVYHGHIFADLYVGDNMFLVNQPLGTLPSSTSGLTQKLVYGPFLWNCGESLSLDDVLIVWKTSIQSVPPLNFGCQDYSQSQCQDVPGITVSTPLAVQYDYTTCVNGNIVTVNFSSTTMGGTQPYSYSWNYNGGTYIGGTASGPIVNYNINNGPYNPTLTVTDVNNNTNLTPYSETLVFPAELQLITSQSNASCTGTDGSGSFTASGGTPPYSFVVNSNTTGGIVSTNGNVLSFTNASSGSINVTVTDAHGCTRQQTITILPGDSQDPNITAPNDYTLQGCGTGAITSLPYSTTATTITLGQLQAAQNGGGNASDDGSIASITYQDVSSGSCPITVTRTFTVTDGCGRTDTDTQIITIQDTTPPAFTSTLPSNVTVQCDNIPVAATVTASDNCGTANVSYNQSQTNGSCPNNFTLTRTWTATDACGHTVTHTQTITVQDTTPPSVASCNVVNQTIECQGFDANKTIADQWDQDNYLELVACATDNCDTDLSLQVTSNYSFEDIIISCGQSGVIPVTYTVTDDCGNVTTINRNFTIVDLTPPDLSSCPVLDQTIECNGSNNQSLANAWNAANIASLIGCASDICDEDFTGQVTSNYNYNNLVSNCGLGGTITVTYTVVDDCNNSSTITGTLTLNDSTPPSLASCNVNSQTIQCNGTNNQSMANAWNAANITALENCAVDGCDNNLTGQVTSNYSYSNLVSTCGLGGTIPVTYTITDDCNNSTTLNVTLTIQDTTPPSLAGCSVSNTTMDCFDSATNESNADAWNASNIAALEACAADACDTNFSGQVTSNYDFNNLNTTCGACGTLNVIYTITDDCGNSTTLSVTLTFNDGTIPDLSSCTVSNETLECDGVNNQTIADQWNAANITALENCADDNNITVTSNYSFSNLVSTCGQAGTIAVVYTITDDCGNATTLNATLTLEDSTDPDLSGCSVASETLECNGANNQAMAMAWNAANIAALEACAADSCDTSFAGQVTSNFSFANLVSTCGLAGTIDVIYTVTDDCGNDTTLNVTLTLEDTTDPDLSACNVVSETIQCDGANNQSLADAWNAANIAALESCAADSCDSNLSGQVTSNYNYSNLVSSCGLVGSIDVTYTVTDDCGNDSTLNVTLTLEDTVAPDLSGCAVVSQTLECNGSDNQNIADAWNAANIAALEACAIDACDANLSGQVTSNYNFANLVSTCGLGGTIAVTYTVTDDCGNPSTLNVTLTLEDNTPPDLTSCSVTSETLQCNGSNNENVADAWNAANIAALEACAVDSCDTSLNGQVTSNYNYGNLNASCGLVGSIDVTYTITDDCGNPSTLTVTLTLEDTTPPDLSSCTVVSETIECNGANNQAMANAWNAANIAALEACATDSCDSNLTGQVTSNYSYSNLVIVCGQTGTIAVTYTVTDDCGNPSTLNVTLTIEDTTPPNLSGCSVVSETIECNGANNQNLADAWDASNIADLAACAADSCDANLVGQVTSNYSYSNLVSTCGLGGTIDVTYTVTDDCGNATTLDVTLTLQDTTPPSLAGCTVGNTTLECDAATNEAMADAWNANNIALLEDCAGDACDGDLTGQVTSNYDFNNLNTTCGPCGTLNVTYTITDECGNVSTLTVTLTLDDGTIPDLSNCTVADETIECDGDNNQSIADAWNAANIASLENCASDNNITVTSDYSFTNLVTTCGQGGTISVVYTITDDCGNGTTVSAILTLEDSTDPDLSGCSVTDQTIECNGADNQSLASAWNAANIAALEACAGDSCDTDLTGQVTSNYNFGNLVSTCGQGGTLAVTYTVTDDCGNSSTLNVTLTLQDTTPPDLSACSVENTTLECTDNNNEALANAWNAANIAALEACAADSCDTDLSGQVTSDYDFNNLNTTCGPCGSLNVTYTVTDDCGNTSTITVTLSFDDGTNPDLSNCDVLDLSIECDGDNNEAIANQWNLDNIAELQACANDISVTVTSNYNFGNLVSTCGQGGTIAVTYTVTDDCGNSTNFNATLTLEDTTPPDLSGCSVTNEVIECDGTDIKLVTDAWDQDNYDALVACATDACSADGQILVESDYDYDNLISNCGLAGVITVNYTVTDSCGNSVVLTATLIVEDTTPPDLSACTVTDASLECAGDDNQAVADAWHAANIVALESCAADSCDDDFTGQITSDYDFNNLVSTCGQGGTIAVVYTITDDCGNSVNLNATLTLEDTTPPDLSNCAVESASIECNGDDNETLSDAWNAANIAALEACAADSCDTDLTGQVTSNYSFSNLVSTCGLGGTIAVTYTVTDDCGNESTLNVTLTLVDTTPPDLSSCAALDATIECDGDNNESLADAWNAANIVALEDCATDLCDADLTTQVTSDYDFGNLVSTCGLGGTIAVVYTVTDDCGNSSTFNATLTLQDTMPPTIDVPAQDLLVDCGNGNNTDIQDWLNANGNASVSDACSTNITWTNDYNGATSNCSSPVSVTFTATDDCGLSISTTATYTIQDITPPNIDTPAADLNVLCDGSGNLVDLQNWLDSFGGATASDDCSTITWSNDFNMLSDDCGETGSAFVTFTATDSCGNTSSTSATFTIFDNIPPVISTNAMSLTVECDGSGNTADLQAWLNSNGGATASDVCSQTITWSNNFVSLSAACGQTGSSVVTFFAEDDCGNISQTQATFTIVDTMIPDLTNCGPLSQSIQCNGGTIQADVDAWNAANIAALEACAVDACDTNLTGQITSDYDFNNFMPSCGGGSISVTYTVTDDCGNDATVTATFSITDNVPPVLTAPATSVNIQCDPNNPNALQNWLNSNGNATATDTCSNVTWTNNYNGATSNCGSPVSVMFTATDDCGNFVTTTASFTINDTTPPVITGGSGLNVECDGTGNTADLQAWLANNGGATATDNCSTITWSNNFTQLTPGGNCPVISSATVTFTAIDLCGNASSTTLTFTIEDTTPPALVTPLPTLSANCDNIPGPPTPTFQDACSMNIIVSGPVTTTVSTGSTTYDVIYTWTVSDDCNTATYSQTINVTIVNNITANNPTLCITEDVDYDLFDSLNNVTDFSGVWTVTQGNATINGSIFNPTDLLDINGDYDISDLGDYIFTYTLTGACPSVNNVTITIDDACVVIPCGQEDVVISNTVTPNNDGMNEVFTVTGVEDCGYIVELEIFNRWGAIIYKNNNYQNDWRATASKASIGNSDKVPTGTYYYIVKFRNSGSNDLALKPITGPMYVATK